MSSSRKPFGPAVLSASVSVDTEAIAGAQAGSGKDIRCYPGWQGAFIKASSFLAVRSSKETHTTRLGHESQILEGC